MKMKKIKIMARGALAIAIVAPVFAFAQATTTDNTTVATPPAIIPATSSARTECIAATTKDRDIAISSAKTARDTELNRRIAFSVAKYT